MEEFIRISAREIPRQEQEIIYVERSLDMKYSELEQLEKEIESLTSVVNIGKRRIEGLNIR